MGASGYQSDSGAVYLYDSGLGDSSKWDQGDFSALVKAPNASMSDFFGTSVSLSADGTTLAVGAHREDSMRIATGISRNPLPLSPDCTVSPSLDCQGGSGAVYIFVRNPNEKWNQANFVAIVKAPNAMFADRFGYRISLSADGATLAVGAIGEDSDMTGIGTITQARDCKATPTVNCLTESGAVYLYERGPNSKWDQGQFVAFIKAPNARDYNLFGASVSLSADGALLAVGAPKDDSGASGINVSAAPIVKGGCATISEPNTCQFDSGAAYLFARDPTSGKWDQGQLAAFVKAPNVTSSDWFGTSVSLSSDGSTLAVGAYMESSAAITTGVSAQITDCRAALPPNCVGFSGAVYLFERDLNRNWSQGQFTAFVKAPNADNSGGFSFSVSLNADGSILAVGAPGEDSAAFTNGISGSAQINDYNATTQSSNCLPNSGAVYVYRQGPSGIWNQGQMTSYFKAPNAEISNNFGSAISLSGDGSTLAIGAPGESRAATGIEVNGNSKNDCRNSDGTANTAATNCALFSGAAFYFNRSSKFRVYKTDAKTILDINLIQILSQRHSLTC